MTLSFPTSPYVHTYVWMYNIIFSNWISRNVIAVGDVLPTVKWWVSQSALSRPINSVLHVVSEDGTVERHITRLIMVVQFNVGRFHLSNAQSRRFCRVSSLRQSSPGENNTLLKRADGPGARLWQPFVPPVVKGWIWIFSPVPNRVECLLTFSLLYCVLGINHIARVCVCVWVCTLNYILLCSR